MLYGIQNFIKLLH